MNTSKGINVVVDKTYEDDIDDASTTISDLSSLDDTSDDEHDDDSLTTVTYMSDFTIFLDDDEDMATTLPLLSANKQDNLDRGEDFICNLSDIVHEILDEIIGLAL